MSRQIDSSESTTRLTAASSGNLFTDTTFQPCSKSLGDGKFDESIVWMRPHEITKTPKFVVEGASRQDLDQGSLGDCWFIAAAVSLASSHPDILNKVILPNEDFDGTDYCGRFRFNFWWFGTWTEVVIDDNIPCKKGKPCYCRCAESTSEMWPCLLEKAYAKLHGSYESLAGGQQHDAMVDLTGGIPQVLSISEKPNIDKLLFERLKAAFNLKTLMGASIQAKERNEEDRDDGLVTGHAYSITGFYEDGKTGHRLVRLRNPWGNSKEWNGAWSDTSEQMRNAPDQTKQELSMKSNDGEFWMSFEDFVSSFDSIKLCHIDPNAWISDDKNNSNHQEWNETVVKSAWFEGATAGGLAKDEFYWNNPKFNIHLDSDVNWLIISLMSQRTDEESETVIKFNIYKADTKMEAFSSGKSSKRDITKLLQLTQGQYVIVPSISDDTKSKDFILRIFSEGHPTIRPST